MKEVLKTAKHSIKVCDVGVENERKGIEISWRNSELERTLHITQDPEHPERVAYSAYRTALYAYNLDGNRPSL